MGIDYLDLKFRIERAFELKLRQEYLQAHTPRDLAELVCSRVQLLPAGKECWTRDAFLITRRGLRQLLGQPLRAPPSQSLTELLPESRRIALWAMLGEILNVAPWPPLMVGRYRSVS